MEPSDRRLKEIFVGALDIAAGPGRSAYVERECLGDASLRDRVEALLSWRPMRRRGVPSPRPPIRAPRGTSLRGRRRPLPSCLNRRGPGPSRQ